jgi:hypothetical protein
MGKPTGAADALGGVAKCSFHHMNLKTNGAANPKEN